MSTFLYAPGVRIFIKTDNIDGTHTTLDVSDDLVDYTVQRRSDGPSTLNFSVQNIQRKYDGMFSPNDEVIVELKRVTWVRVFTGLLNSVPLITMWPRVVSFSASCSLKRLQYWYWDPNLATSYEAAIAAMSSGTTSSDSGMSNVMLSLLRDVVGWPENKVHIGAIPPNWFKLVIPYATALRDQVISADAQVLKMFNSVGGGQVANTPVDGTSTPSGSPTTTQSQGFLKNEVGQAKNYAPGESTWPNQVQLDNAETIIRVGKNRGIPDPFIAGALAVSAGESRWNAGIPNSTGDGGLGLFQQGIKWITPTSPDRTDPAQAANHFFAAFESTNPAVYAHKSPTWACLYVNDGWSNAKRKAQREPAEVPKHEKFTLFAQHILQVYNNAKSAGSTANDSNSTSAGTTVVNSQTGTAGAIPMALDFITKARDLTAPGVAGSFPHIPYGAISLSRLTQAFRTNTAPPNLGCSSFVTWVLLNYFGKIPSGWAHENAAAQYQWCKSHGGQEFAHGKEGLIEASKTQGALFIRHPHSTGYRGQAKYQDPGHIEISVGDGAHTFGAYSPGHTPQQVGEGDLYLDQFDTAILMPSPTSFVGWGFDYSQAKSGGPPMVSASNLSSNTSTLAGVTAVSTGTVAYSSTSGFNPKNPIDQLFGPTIAVGQDNPKQKFEDSLASAFAGPRALLNDQPLLPYIKNLVNASMRSFCSAPNGDFMAWFPDYYGLWGTAAIMQIEAVELQDFYVEWTDDYFVTHQYTVAGSVNSFDAFQGTVQTTFGDPGTGVPFDDARTITAGIASIDIPAIMYALFGINLTPSQAEAFRQHIYQKFGARPDFKEMDGMIGKAAEIFSAMYYFMRQWTYQYNANVPLTFMPEIWPGMLLQIPEYNFQCYVTAVTHSGQMGEGGGHQTMVNVAAPARLPDGTNTHHLIGLPLASGVLESTGNVTELVDPGLSSGQEKKISRIAKGGL